MQEFPELTPGLHRARNGSTVVNHSMHPVFVVMAYYTNGSMIFVQGLPEETANIIKDFIGFDVKVFIDVSNFFPEGGKCLQVVECIAFIPLRRVNAYLTNNGIPKFFERLPVVMPPACTG